MVDFAARASALLPRLAGERGDPAIAAELQALRAAWRELDPAGRRDAAPLAAALAAAQAPPPPQANLFEQDAALRAVTGIDRIDDVDTAFECRYEGPQDPDSLLAHFGLPAFRPGQRDAVEAALGGRDSLVVMPTGGGKSLCYQLPGIASDELTVVVSPLIALMADQYRRLRLGGHPVAMIASGMDARATADAMEQIGGGRARIVLCSPERFASSSFLDALARRTIDLFAVDEAHCVSEWGHDFRPDYLRLRGVIERLGRPAVMACTATATEEVGEEIVLRLGLRDPHVLRAGFDRPNLSLDVVPVDGTGAKARKGMLLQIALREAGSRPAIVYCGTRREVEEVTESLRAEGLTAVGYHAGMPPDERAAAQHRFMAGDAEIVVATNAFGMGVDKADVRAVVHWSLPKSVEAYYQEVGRAGRDGAPARGILLAGRADLGRLVTFIKDGIIEPADVFAFVRRLGAAAESGRLVMEAPPADRDRVCLGIAERAGFLRLEPVPGRRLLVELSAEGDAAQVASICRDARDRLWRAYRAIEAFSSAEGVCRRATLLTHFGDPSPPAPSGRCCDVCDPEGVGLPDPATLKPARRRSAAAGAGRGAGVGRGAGGARGAGSGPEEAEALAPADERLFEALRAWRVGAAEGKPAYTVAHNRTLELIATQRPISVAELGRIRGVGPSFVERHGPDVLGLVAAH